MGEYNYNLRKLSSKHKNKVILFLSQNFNGEQSILKSVFDFTISNMPSTHIYTVYERKIIHGAFILLNRFLCFNNVKFNFCGMSFMAKKKEIKDNQIVNFLIEKILQECNKSILSLGFASKKMDGFWYRFGFIGVDNFSEFTVSIRNSVNLVNDKIKIIPFNKSRLKDIILIYDSLSKDLDLSIERTVKDWQYAIKKHQDSYNFRILKHNNRIIGYFVFKDNEIYELLFSGSFQILKKKLYSFFINLKYEKIVFKLSLNHPFIKFLSLGPDYNIKYRRVLKGGHILRINHIETFCFKMKKTLEKNIKELGISKYSLNYCGAEFIFKNSNLEINFTKSFKENDYSRIEFAKLFFGLHNFEGINKLIFRPINFRFSILDHF